ncbi:hypothetical protein L227DRAFT_655353 [Lentinus tigrinus ALCF2SS1-6]|uniref:Uncharacterized protein n=1 Tax=Lentinus tigrinus ALCF2SS1-6 TaxID=1328759 RepID=A0A5C2S1S3_9APHY|nr:hypothetical protein L227DRAFT_655353 [Lentinus tigrinus ALCF2SS1-6]
MAALVKSNIDLAVVALGLIVYIQFCIFFYTLTKKVALPNVLQAADNNQTRTLKLLRRGVGVIPLAEHKALLSRYSKLQKLRDPITGYRLRPLAGLHPGVRGWLADVRALREAAEVTFKRYESEDIARVLDGNVNKLV